jgi:NAD-dependent deacetylase
VVSASGVVQPAASFALWARRSGAKVVEINPAPTPLAAHCHVALSGTAGEVLPSILNLLLTRKNLDRLKINDKHT